MNQGKPPIRLTANIRRDAETIFLPVVDRLCVTCHCLAGGGKRTLINYLLEDQTDLRSIFGKQFDSTIFVFVDPDNILEESAESYLELINDCLEQKLINMGLKDKFTWLKLKNPIFNLKDILNQLIAQKYHVVFILNDFEYTLNFSPNIYRNLESILGVNKQNITFIFLSIINLLHDEVLDKFHNLKFAINRVVRYLHLFSQEDIKYIIGAISQNNGYKFPPNSEKMFYDLCGGHPQLLKYTLNNANELVKNKIIDIEQIRQKLLLDDQLMVVCRDIWKGLNEFERNIVTSVVQTRKLPPSKQVYLDYLHETGLIKEISTGIYIVFGELFDQFVKNRQPENKLVYDAQSKQLLLGQKCLTSHFSLQEMNLLSCLLAHEGEVVSRDDVAEALWGNEAVDKYSDWTIDKIVSTTRKKLEQYGYCSDKLVTLKKRGFSINN